MKQFTFKSYWFDESESLASFEYAFEDGPTFRETVKFERGVQKCDEHILDRALFLAFILIGTSYYKTFPSAEVSLDMSIDKWQADFFNNVYQEGLSQFAYENNLHRGNLAHFVANAVDIVQPLQYNGNGILALQSGGKDSLLTVSMLENKSQEFIPWYLASGVHHPALLDEIGLGLVTSVRSIDKNGLQQALKDGALNGHVPITYIIQSLAVIQAILLNKSKILVSIAHEGEEPHGRIGDLEVTHQWSKTWVAEKNFAEYVQKYISPGLMIGSPLRCYSELRVAELFVEYAWKKYGLKFSSCNLANYRQGEDNSRLKWCGSCSKCANTYLLFAPFVSADELITLFGNKDLFIDPEMELIFKGLLGIDGTPKPFECVGEIDELRLAYSMCHEKGGYGLLPFYVPQSSFDYKKTYESQNWATKMLQ